MGADPSRTSSTEKLLRGCGLALLLAYPICVYLAIGRVNVRRLSLGLVVIVAASLVFRVRGKRREHALVMARLPVSIGVLLLLGAWFDDPRFVLALPALTNAVLLAQFAGSLLSMPIIERFARAQEDHLSTAQIAYCRSVTIVWCAFFLLNGGVSAALALVAPVKVWAAYAGGISYALAGLVFAVEYVVRTVRFHMAAHPWLNRLLGRAGPTEANDRGASDFKLLPQEGKAGTFTVHVPVDLAYFRGHFPGHPILPGIVQLQVLAVRQAARLWPELTRLRRVTRLRFKRPIRPGEDLVLVLKRGENVVQFDIRCGTEPCSSGTLHFEV